MFLCAFLSDATAVVMMMMLCWSWESASTSRATPGPANRPGANVPVRRRL